MITIPDATFENILNDVIKDFLIPKHKALGMEATGEWINSLETKGNVIRGRKYTEQLVYGRSAGKAPPISPLEKWVNAKFGISGKEATSFAFAISKKIAKEGTTWKKKGGSDLLQVLETKPVIDFINSKLSKYLQAEITLQIQRQLREL
jgi:hypothetical protein